jgi:IS30 family transposase
LKWKTEIPGHWDGDLIVGKDHKSAVGTLVELSTPYCLLVHLDGKDAESVKKAFAKKIKELPRDLTKTFTHDRSKEMTQHKKFTMATRYKFIFVTLTAHGNAVHMKTQTGLLEGYFQKERTLIL